MARYLLAFASILALSACGEQTTQQVAGNPDLGVVERTLDAETGKTLFISKGCVLCHSVNGVGGKAAPAFDAPIGAPPIDPLDFAARMWLGAPAMIELQSVELGYSIFLTADEIADLSAFAGDVTVQKTLTIDEVPQNLRDGFLDEQFWEMEDWDAFLRRGQETEDGEELPVDQDGG